MGIEKIFMAKAYPVFGKTIFSYRWWHDPPQLITTQYISRVPGGQMEQGILKLPTIQSNYFLPCSGSRNSFLYEGPGRSWEPHRRPRGYFATSFFWEIKVPALYGAVPPNMSYYLAVVISTGEWEPVCHGDDISHCWQVAFDKLHWVFGGLGDIPWSF